jgi:hypothetical protein
LIIKVLEFSADLQQLLLIRNAQVTAVFIPYCIEIFFFILSIQDLDNPMHGFKSTIIHVLGQKLRKMQFPGNSKNQKLIKAMVRENSSNPKTVYCTS